MNFIKTNLNKVKKYYGNYYNEINGGFDDFFEDQIIEGNHYIIKQNNNEVGCFVISKEGKLICIYLENNYKYLYEKVFDKIISYNNISGIMTISSDTSMMYQILKNNFNTIKQANNFNINKHTNSLIKLVKASLKDVEDIKLLFKDFLDDYEDRIAKDKLFLGYNTNNEIVSLGLIQKHLFNENVASIGFCVVESERNNGYAFETAKALANQCINDRLRVQAGCWYYNHASKKTLLKAGFSISNMIIIVDQF